MRDGEDSRRRVLEAATDEFARSGFAGARVDRIAATARVNKAQMYAWYGSKDGLFDAVFARQLEQIVDGVPFTADDLAGYAVALYDSYLTDPHLVRLASWHRLERAPAGNLLVGHAGLTQPKLDAITRAQRDGTIVPGIRPDDVYAIVIALAGAWSPISATFAASLDDPAGDHRRRRRVLRRTVRSALMVPRDPGPA